MNTVDELMQGAFNDRVPDLSLAPGDAVRSYDFAGRLDCYVDGVIEQVTEPMQGCPRYAIRVASRVFEGVPCPAEADIVYPPVNGTQTLFGKLTNFVVRRTH